MNIVCVFDNLQVRFCYAPTTSFKTFFLGVVLCMFLLVSVCLTVYLCVLSLRLSVCVFVLVSFLYIHILVASNMT